MSSHKVDTAQLAVKDWIRYQFQNPGLLSEALTHKSFCVDSAKAQPHNERLEFLGDAVLGLVIAQELSDRFPNDNEGVLSKKRASLINQRTLAKLALTLKLDQLLRFGPGEINQGSALNPRLLAAGLEALIGGIFLDSNFMVCAQWVKALFKDVDIETDEHNSIISDHKTRLQEYTQKMKMGTPVYELVHTSGPSHRPQFVVCLKLENIERARAQGTSKKAAEQSAAEIFLNELEKNKK